MTQGERVLAPAVMLALATAFALTVVPVRGAITAAAAGRLVKPAAGPPGQGPPPGDLFLESVITRNGSLGWQQLCPAIRRQVSEGVVRNQADAQRAAEAGDGLQLTAHYVRSVPRVHSGEIRYYLVTAHRKKDGWVGRRLYIVQTGPGGCVENVENTDG
jgi:hypothetical protein